MTLEITGVVKAILPEENGVGKSNGNEWKKRDFVITTEGEYPKDICFTMWNAKSEVLAKVKIGDGIKVRFNAESREYNGKWYTNLTAYQISKTTASNAAQSANTATNNTEESKEEEEDPPF